MRNLNVKYAGLFAASLCAMMAGSAFSQAIPGVSDQQIRDFYATNPSNDKIEAMARELGLNNDQIMRATEIGTGIDYKTAPSWQVLGAYEQANHTTGTYARPNGTKDGQRQDSLYAPNLGREVTPTEIAAFYATNPSASQVLAKAAELGISAAAIPNAAAFGSGSYQGSEAKDFQSLNMGNSLNTGANGYGANSAGQVVSVKDSGAMYSSDPLHTGLDRHFNDGQTTGAGNNGAVNAVPNNPAIPNKKWVGVQSR